MTTVNVGDRVYITDPALTELRAIMRSFGEAPKPNHHGTVKAIDDVDTVEVWFDSDEYGKGMGQCSFYPPSQVRPFPDPEYPEAT